MDQNTFTQLLQKVALRTDDLNSVPLESLLSEIRRVDSLLELPAGTRVLVRGDIDDSVRDNRVVDLTRLESCRKTLDYCRERGWITILLGHLGRDASATTRPVAAALNEHYGFAFQFIEDWFDSSCGDVLPSLEGTLTGAEPGCQFILKNTRKYDFERALWSAKTSSQCTQAAAAIYPTCQSIARKIGHVEINEAIAASNVDVSSSAVPLLMQRTALGFFIAEELKKHVVGVRDADFVVFRSEAIAASNVDVSSSAVPLLMQRTALGFFIAEELKKHVVGVRDADFVVF